VKIELLTLSSIYQTYSRRQYFMLFRGWTCVLFWNSNQC